MDTAQTHLVAFPRDGDLVGVVAVTAIVAGVDLTVHEPRLVTLLERAALDSVERTNPRQALLYFVFW